MMHMVPVYEYALGWTQCQEGGYCQRGLDEVFDQAGGGERVQI